MKLLEIIKILKEKFQYNLLNMFLFSLNYGDISQQDAGLLCTHNNILIYNITLYFRIN